MKANTSFIGEEVKVEPIALVGIGCRFPGGAHNPESFWELLREGGDAIVDAPPERWNLRRFYDPDPNKPGKMYTRQGGFLQQRVDEFDALFFGIAPREAECIDPQQRLLLETSWEALEDAGIPYESLAGSNTGVFIGAFTLDHKLTQMGKMNRDLIGTHTAIGSTMTILSNRISYTLDLRGPSISLDTACSSSLVALHLACQSIWRGECNLAMAGGVNVMMRPEYPVAMCKGGFLAPDGRSKSFDSSANGYGRGEGAGVVVLKPLSAALRDGDSIYALVRGTGANQDGRTNGITVPNPESQTALIQNVCEKYGVDTHEVYYFEAHGTGTPVGDPLEARALGTALGQRPETNERCLLGSVKASIGHLEAAAGVAGFIKTALCLSHRQVPPQANLNTPNPNIPFDELGLRLPRKLEPLAPGKERVYAGVNSFGYGGTNAHVILENSPALTDVGCEETGKTYVLPLSARSEAALTDLAKAWLERFTEANAPGLKNLCYSAACRRGHHNYRMAVAGDSLTAVREQLQSFVEQGRGEWLSSAKIAQTAEKPVFVYTGMGPQWWAMGRELYRTDSVYRQAVEECDAIFRRLSGWSILEEMLADEGQSRISDTEVAQPANFLIQAGLTAVWRALGIEPAAIVGHSVGEVSAAYVAGVLSLEDAVKVSYHRSRIQKQAAGLGKMLAVGISLEQCSELLALTDGGVSIAAVNSPSAVTLAGDAHSLEAIATYLDALGEFNRFLQVEVAYHSHFMEPLKPEVREVLSGLQPGLPNIPLYSTCTGDLVNAIAYDAEYWCNNIREPVYFAKAMESLLRDGHRVFLEIGPHPVLSSSIKECCRKQNIQPQTFASLRRERPELRTLNLALAGLYTVGCEMDWRKMYPHDSRYVKLPTYPWQRETYWREAEESIADRIGSPIHPLLDRRLPDPKPSWQSVVNRQFIPYLDDHRVDGLVVMPGAVYVEAGLAAFAQLNGTGPCVLENLSFHQALVLDAEGGEPVLHVSLDEENGEYLFFSREYDDHLNWRLHASGKSGLAKGIEGAKINRQEIEERCQEKISVNQLYADLGQRGLLYGPYFRTVCQLQRCHGEVLAKVELHEALLDDATGYRLHPTLLDGCFQSLIVALEDSDNFYMPVSVKRITYHQAPGQTFWCHGKLNRVNEQGIEGDLSLFDDEGRLLVEVQGLRCRALVTQKENPAEQLARWAYTWNWLPKALQPTNPRIGTWLVFSDTRGVGESLCRDLEVNKANKLIRVPAQEFFPHESGSVRPLNADGRSRLYDVLQQAKASGCVGVVYLWGLDANAESNDPIGVAQAGAALQVVQMLGEVFDTHAPRMYMITEGAQPVMDTDDMQNMAQTPLIGLARVTFNEYPALRCSLIDLDASHSNSQIDLLKLELLSDDSEDDVALRGSERYVHRLERYVPAAHSSVINTQNTLNGTEVEAFYLKKEANPVFCAMPRPEPNIGEVLVALDCINLTGVNLDTDTDWENVNGYFATGIICGVGNGVTDWRKGQVAIVAAEGMPASHIICPVHRVFSAANFTALSNEEAAALMTTIVPAYYALRHVARVSPGETVLIDADSGAIAYALDRSARWLDARPLLYSTNDARLLVSESLNGESTIETREPDISELLIAESKTSKIRAWIRSPQAKQPVVVNPSAAIGTHEIVIGHANADENPLRSLNGSSFSHVDALNLAFTSPDIVSQLLVEISQFLNNGQKLPSVMQTLTPEQTLASLASCNDGDVTHTQVLSIKDRLSVPVSSAPMVQPFFDAGAAYMITGGFGGFGLETANWMVKNGAKNLILVGRRGASDDASKLAVKALEDNGVIVMAVAADISDAIQVEKLLERVAAECPPLKGVLHAAAVLDDAAIAELNPERMAAVMQAKAMGAWHLHNLTQNQPLNFFVLFSSVSALIGNARQANYAAANTFLDALAWRRKAMGLPATSINWGAIATGMAVGSDEVKKHLELMGMYPVTAMQALEAWVRMRDTGMPQYGLMDCNWSRWQEFEPTGGNSPRFSKLMDSSGDGQESLLTGVYLQISQLPEEERSAAMGKALSEQVAKILRLPSGKIDMQQSLTQMGVDSLMAAELQAAIHQTFGVRVSTLKLMRGQSLAHLADMLMESVHLSTVSHTDDAQAHESSLVDRLSGEDVDILLNQLLMEEGK